MLFLHPGPGRHRAAVQGDPKGFLPSEDTGRLVARVEAEQGVAFEDMVRRQKALMQILDEDPEVEGYMSVVGAGGPNGAGNSGRLMVRMTPRDQGAGRRGHHLAASPKIPFRGAGGQDISPKSPAGPHRRPHLQGTVPVHPPGAGHQGIIRMRRAARRAAARPAELQDVSSDIEIKNPELRLAIDRDKASALGVTAYQIEDALATAFGNRAVSYIYAPSDTYEVIMELAPEFQANPEALSLLHVRSNSGKLIPMDVLTKRTLSVGPLSVNHSGQMPSATLSFNLRPASPWAAPWTGCGSWPWPLCRTPSPPASRARPRPSRTPMSGMWLLLILSILVIYIVLGILYESFIHPLTILSGLPSAGVGALATLMFFTWT